MSNATQFGGDLINIMSVFAGLEMFPLVQETIPDNRKADIFLIKFFTMIDDILLS
jgi:hypothetical protein